MSRQQLFARPGRIALLLCLATITITTCDLGLAAAQAAPVLPGNDGTVHTRWNERWDENWVSRSDGQDRAGLQARNQWTTFEPTDGPIKGFVAMNRDKAVQTAFDIRNLMSTMLELWTPRPDKPGRSVTLHKLERLATCLEQNTCKPGETTVVIGGSHHFSANLKGENSGEDMWAKSVIEAVEEDLGHTLLYADSALEAATLYQGISHLVSTVIMEADQVKRCSGLGVPSIISADDLSPQAEQGRQVPFEQAQQMRRHLGLPDPSEEDAHKIWGWRGMYGLDVLEEKGLPIGCMKRRGFEQGIPVWKTFSFNFWPSADHPLGRPWTLSPEDYGNFPGAGKGGSNFYLGYTIERACKQTQAVPREQREDRAFILAKETSYFHEGANRFWSPNNTFDYLADKTDMRFISMAGNADDVLPDPGVRTIGRKPREDFLREVSHSVAMVGLGNPTLSPTPYESLCLGVPFINPMDGWDADDIDNRDRWNTQHNGLVEFSAPYVYHVPAHDVDALEKALQAARQTSIESFVPERMTAKAMKERVQSLINLDWKTLFRQRVVMEDWDARSSALVE